MTKKNISIAALAAVLVMSMAAFAVAGSGYGRGFGGGCGGPGYGQAKGFAQLTPEKQAEVQAVYDKFAPQFDKLREQMWTKRSTLQAMVNGGKADEKAIGGLVSDISKLRTQMWDLRKGMSDELVKVTGITDFGGFGTCPRYGQNDCPGYGDGQGRGMGRGQGRGMGYGPGPMVN